jgi:fatty acid desaturase
MNAIDFPSATADEQQLIRQARAIVQDLFRIRPHIYWLDHTFSMLAAYFFAGVFVQSSWASPWAWIGYVVAAICLYRISMFVHEAVHFGKGEMVAFRRYWNFTTGIPLLIPTFAYESHLSHHNTRDYGTNQDGEYLPLASGGWRGIALFLAQVFFQPLLVFLRFAVGTPISMIHPRLRRWLHEHATSLVINLRFRRTVRNERFTTAQTLLELTCSLRAIGMIAVVVLGFDSPDRLLKLYMLAVGSLSLNHIRTLAAHRYQSTGHAMSHADQFLDSTNITGGWLTELICPVGLRYHALHHLFPSLPYHNLGKAHQRLVAELPRNSIYFQNIFPSVVSALRQFLGSVRFTNRTSNWNQSTLVE